MSELRPRLGRDQGRLLCGFAPRGSTVQRCSGALGRLAMSALRRNALIELGDIPGDPPELRAAVEAQAPPAALVALIFVLPEGMVAMEGAWRPSRHRLRAERAAQRLGRRRQAGRRAGASRASSRDVAVAPILPATVRCPECRRANLVSRAALDDLRGPIAADLNRHANLPRDVYTSLVWAGEELGFPLLTTPAEAWPVVPIGIPDPDPPLSAAAPDQPIAPDDVVVWAAMVGERLRLLVPMYTLVVGLAGGRPVAVDDFFVVAPPTNLRVALPDRPRPCTAGGARR